MVSSVQVQGIDVLARVQEEERERELIDCFEEQSLYQNLPELHGCFVTFKTTSQKVEDVDAVEWAKTALSESKTISISYLRDSHIFVLAIPMYLCNEDEKTHFVALFFFQNNSLPSPSELPRPFATFKSYQTKIDGTWEYQPTKVDLITPFSSELKPSDWQVLRSLLKDSCYRLSPIMYLTLYEDIVPSPKKPPIESSPQTSFRERVWSSFPNNPLRRSAQISAAASENSPLEDPSASGEEQLKPLPPGTTLWEALSHEESDNHLCKATCTFVAQTLGIDLRNIPYVEVGEIPEFSKIDKDRRIFLGRLLGENKFFLFLRLYSHNGQTTEEAQLLLTQTAPSVEAVQVKRYHATYTEYRVEGIEKWTASFVKLSQQYLPLDGIVPFEDWKNGIKPLFHQGWAWVDEESKTYVSVFEDVGPGKPLRDSSGYGEL